MPLPPPLLHLHLRYTTHLFSLLPSHQAHLAEYLAPISEVLLTFCLAWFIPDVLGALGEWLRERDYPKYVVKIPEAASPSYTSRIISSPTIEAHLTDKSLLPTDHASHDASTKYITCYDPATGYHIQTLPLPTLSQLSALIHRAEAAFPKWRKTTFRERRRFLRCFKGWMMRNLREVGRVAMRDTGKTEVDATFGEILTTLSKIDYLVTYGESALREERRPGNLLLLHKRCKIVYEPLGVVCAIVSWNYPIHNALSPIIAALFAGNTVVLKCSEQVLWSTTWIVNSLKTALSTVGLDPEAVQLVCCYPEDAEIVTRHPAIKHILFIGSEHVGKMVARAAADSMIPTTMELGGKDCALLLPSADLKYFASTFMRAAFQACGQNCIGIERFIVHRSIYKEFLQIMEPRVRNLRCGPSLSADPASKSEGEIPTIDCGAMISDNRFDHLESLISSAEKQGAKLLVGGKRLSHPTWTHGHYFEPTLLADVTPEMEVATTELFAPVMTIIPYDTVEEGVRIANGTRYGLGSAVFGADRAECRRVADRMKAGMVAINDFAVFYLNQSMPFGGVGHSGHGRLGGPEGLRSLCSIKSIAEDRFFSWVRTSIPAPVDYPLPARLKTWGFLKGLLSFVYGESAKDRFDGLVDVAKHSL